MREYSFICEECDNHWSIVCSMSEYSSEQSCPKCKSVKTYRDYAEDSTHMHYSYGLHECKTLGHYADKQRKKYGEEKSKRMLESFKTKKDPNSGMKELPSGMSRVKTKKDIANMPSSRKRKKK